VLLFGKGALTQRKKVFRNVLILIEGARNIDELTAIKPLLLVAVKARYSPSADKE